MIAITAEPKTMLNPLASNPVNLKKANIDATISVVIKPAFNAIPDRTFQQIVRCLPQITPQGKHV